MKKLIISLFLLTVLVHVSAQDQLTNSGNLQMHPGTSITFFGSFANHGTFIDSGLVVTFQQPATISGTSIATFRHLVINASTLTLQQSIIVSDSLVLASGPIVLNGKSISITNSSPSALRRTTGYLVSEQTDNSGKVIWTMGSTTGARIYPFGTAAGDYIPFTLNLTSGDIGDVTVSTYPSAADNTPYPSTPDLVTNVNDPLGSNNSANMVDRFWQVDKSGPTGTVTMTFTASSSEIGSINTLITQRWNSSTQKWDDPLPGQTNTATAATVSNVSGFSSWVMLGGGNLLPIELLTFTAALNDKHVDLNWVTATEINNEYFVIEKSKDGALFEQLATVEGAGNSITNKYYSIVDNRPFTGISYYRLNQVDFDGHNKYSRIRSVYFKVSQSYIKVFPNPVAGHEFYIRLNTDDQKPLRVSLFDITGKIVLDEMIAIDANTFRVLLNQHINPGTYLIQLSGGYQTLLIKL